MWENISHCGDKFDLLYKADGCLELKVAETLDKE